jgi:hypothetical protein
MSALIIDEVIEQMKKLPEDKQRRVLEFTRELTVSRPRGTPGRELLRFVGAISKESAEMMRKAIEEDCERIDADEW